jgi:hypothetical protein
MLASLLLAAVLPASAAGWAYPRHDVQCAFQGVLAILGLKRKTDVPLPPVFLQSETPLKRYQDAVEPQWKFRPGVFANVYVARKNEIYLMNESAYYASKGRFVDDSLAHELTHYVQVKYLGVPMEEMDDSLESQAVSVQTEFRERFMKTGLSPCP